MLSPPGYMRGTRAALLVAAALCLLAPAALSAQTFSGAVPVGRAPLVPQLFCEIVYEVAGTQRCDVYGPLTNANELRVTMTGASGRVFVLADDISNDHITRQLVTAECRGGCVVPFTLTTASHVRLGINTWGSQGAVMSVSLGTGLSGVLS